MDLRSLSSSSLTSSGNFMLCILLDPGSWRGSANLEGWARLGSGGELVWTMKVLLVYKWQWSFFSWCTQRQIFTCDIFLGLWKKKNCFFMEQIVKSIIKRKVKLLERALVTIIWCFPSIHSHLVLASGSIIEQGYFHCIYLKKWADLVLFSETEALNSRWSHSFSIFFYCST